MEQVQATWNGEAILGCQITQVIDEAFPEKDKKTASLGAAFLSGAQSPTIQPPSKWNAAKIALTYGYITYQVLLFAISQKLIPLSPNTLPAAVVVVGVGGGAFAFRSEKIKYEAEQKCYQDAETQLKGNLKTVIHLLSKKVVQTQIKENGWEGQKLFDAHFTLVANRYQLAVADWQEQLLPLYENFKDIKTEEWIAPVMLEAEQE